MGRPAALVSSNWHEEAVAAITELAHTQALVTAEDLRKVMEDPENGNRIGPAFRSAHQRNIITPVHYRPSRNRSRRGGGVQVWTLHPSQEKRTP